MQIRMNRLRQLRLESEHQSRRPGRGRLCRARAGAGGAGACAPVVRPARLAGDRRHPPFGRGDRGGDLPAVAGARRPAPASRRRFRGNTIMMASYGTFGETRRRRRRNAWWSVVRFLAALVAVLAVGVYAYQVGVSANETRIGAARGGSGALPARQSRPARPHGVGRRAASGRGGGAGEHAAALCCGRFQAAKRPICSPRCGRSSSAGVDPERLAVLIEAAGQEDTCHSEPVTKRFMPRTPVSTGPVSWVRFDDRITVTGEGESARSETGLRGGLVRSGAARPPAIPDLRRRDHYGSRGSFRSTTGWRSTVRNTGSARSASRRGSSKSPARPARCRNPVTNRARAPTGASHRAPAFPKPDSFTE